MDKQANSEGEVNFKISVNFRERKSLNLGIKLLGIGTKNLVAVAAGRIHQRSTVCKVCHIMSLKSTRNPKQPNN